MFGKNKDKIPAIKRAFTFRLDPDPEQKRTINRFAGITRACHNKLLEFVKNQEKYPGLCRLMEHCVVLKNEPGLDFFAKAPAQSLQCAASELDASFQRFFESCKKQHGKKRGYPKFHKRGRNDSFRTPQGGFLTNGRKPKGFCLDQENSRVYIPKIGWIRYVSHRDVTTYKKWSGGIPKAAVVKRDKDRHFLTIFMEYPGVLPEKADQPVDSCGIDRGVKRNFQTSGSADDYYNLPKKLDEIYDRIDGLKSLRDSRCRKKSRKWKDMSRKIRDLHFRAGNIKRDFIHKLTTRLSKTHGLIAIEKLEIANMTGSAAGTLENPGSNVTRKAGLNRSILASCWGMFKQLLSYKMDELGHWLIEVDPRNTSRRCSVCGRTSPDNRRTQEFFRCVSCGHEDNADHNAALNILSRGLKEFQSGRMGRSSGDVVPETATRPAAV